MLHLWRFWLQFWRRNCQDKFIYNEGFLFMQWRKVLFFMVCIKLLNDLRWCCLGCFFRTSIENGSCHSSYSFILLHSFHSIFQFSHIHFLNYFKPFLYPLGFLYLFLKRFFSPDHLSLTVLNLFVKISCGRVTLCRVWLWLNRNLQYLIPHFHLNIFYFGELRININIIGISYCFGLYIIFGKNLYNL